MPRSAAPAGALQAQVATQASMFSSWRFLVADARGIPVGELLWPDLAQARNARLRWHGTGNQQAGNLQLVCRGRRLQVAFEYLDRSWANDVRYTLFDSLQPDGLQTLACAELRHAPGRVARGVMSLQRPWPGQLRREPGWLRRRWTIERAGQDIGWVGETRLLSLKREIRIELPADVDLPTRLFILMLACHLVVQQA